LSGILLSACSSTPTHEQIQATFNEGLKDYDAHNYKAAYDKWKSIQEADVAAMRNIAIMLRKGEGIPKDPKLAQSMMLAAAEAGLVTAQADLGEMLLKGEAGPPDPKAAVPWLAAAAQAGHPLAAFELGEMYEQGNGVKKDIDTARKLYKLAATAGVQEAGEKLKNLPPEAAPANHVQAGRLSPPPALRH
jgi:TPR repeat protein